MPTQSRGFWTCDNCGVSFDTLDQAKEHESTQCRGRLPPQRTAAPSAGEGGAPAVPPSYVTPPAPVGASHGGYSAGSRLPQPPMPPQHHQHLPPSHPRSYPQHQQHDRHVPPLPYHPHGGQPREMPYESISPPNGGGPHHQHEPDYYYPSSGMSHPSSYRGPGPGPDPGSGSGSGSGSGPGPGPALRSVVLLRPQDVADLPTEDCIACQNIEFFESTPELAAEFDVGRTGGIPVSPGQVGLRCIHCAHSPLPSAVYSVVFPSHLGNVSSAVRTIADQHLCTCGMVPREIQEACDHAASKRRREESDSRLFEIERRNRLALSEYCIGLSHHLGITDKQPTKSGIVFADVVAPPSRRPPSTVPGDMVSTGGTSRGLSTERRLGAGSVLRLGAATMMGPPGPSGDSDVFANAHQRRDRASGGGFDFEGGRGYSTPYSLGSLYGADVSPNAYDERGYAQSPMYLSEPAPPMYDLPANFPFYQESDGFWHCKFCSHLHPQYKDPKAVWSSASHGPPPGNFIDYHLSMCRPYRQGGPPSMYGAPPPPPSYGGRPYNTHMAPYGSSDQGWEGSASIHPSQLSFGAPSHGEQLYSSYSVASRDRPRRLSDSLMSSFEPMRVPPSGGTPASRNVRAMNMKMEMIPGLPQVPHHDDHEDNSAQSSAINHLIVVDKKRQESDKRKGNPALVLDEDKNLLTDYFFYLMKQLRECRFSESDRKTRGGKREKIQIGYGGLQCVHCSDVPNSRKFFWSNVDRLANSFAEIPGHILKCRRCPQQTKDALNQLKKTHPEQMARLARGSQKVFFRRMWRRLHPSPDQAGLTTATSSPGVKESASPTASVKMDPDATASPDEFPNIVGQVSNTDSPESDTGGVVSPAALSRSTSDAAKLLAMAPMEGRSPSPSTRVLLATPVDREWLSDMDCFIRQQLEVFCAGDNDVNAVRQERKYPIHVGQVGIRCLHCSASRSGNDVAAGTAVSFPYSISGIYESVREFQRLHMNTCENIPTTVKQKISGFKGSSSLSSVLRRYYIIAAKSLGLYDTRDGIRSGGESIPISAQSAFSFSESYSNSVSDDRHVNPRIYPHDRSIAAPLPSPPLPPPPPPPMPPLLQHEQQQHEYVEDARKRKASEIYRETEDSSPSLSTSSSRKEARIVENLSNLGEKVEV